MRYLIFLVLLPIYSVCNAEDFNSPPPVNLMILNGKVQYEGIANKGAHGLESYCYSVGTSYVTLEKNSMGEGYSFHSTKPFPSCQAPSFELEAENILGLKLGLTSVQTAELLGTSVSEGNNKFTWHYQRPIRNLPFDDFTTLHITVENDQIKDLTLFNVVSY